MRVVACRPHENPHEPWIYHKFERHICYKCEVKQRLSWRGVHQLWLRRWKRITLEPRDLPCRAELSHQHLGFFGPATGPGSFVGRFTQDMVKDDGLTWFNHQRCGLMG
jgi:hypothetical protein